jgi:stearoyl-CoA desaturase (delta-9 desaturase)
MYVLTVLGITVGFHRLFTHRAFETNIVVAFVFGVLGSMAAQGRLFNWVALHRRHHQHSDDLNDPHSPHHMGEQTWGVLRGMWHAHLGWIFRPKPLDLPRYVKDLNERPTFRVLNHLFFVWVGVGLLIPAAIGGLITQSWSGAFWGFVWGGLVRVLLVHHVTWSINSVCHIWGRRPYKSGDESRNNFLFGVLALGEGWHNSHHAFPTSARHGLRWWQPDVSYWVIRALAALGLAWNLKLPPLKTQIAREMQN